MGTSGAQNSIAGIARKNKASFYAFFLLFSFFWTRDVLEEQSGKTKKQTAKPATERVRIPIH